MTDIIKQTEKILYEVSDINKAKPIYKDATIEIGGRPLFKVESDDITKYQDCHGRIHFIKFEEKIDDVYDDPDEQNKDRKIIEKITVKSATIEWNDKQRFNDLSNEEIDREISYLEKLKNV